MSHWVQWSGLCVRNGGWERKRRRQRVEKGLDIISYYNTQWDLPGNKISTKIYGPVFTQEGGWCYKLERFIKHILTNPTQPPHRHSLDIRPLPLFLHFLSILTYFTRYAVPGSCNAQRCPILSPLYIPLVQLFLTPFTYLNFGKPQLTYSTER